MNFGLLLFALIACVPLVQNQASASSSFFVQPNLGYQQARFFQESQTSAYSGASYGLSAYYRIQADQTFSVAPVISYLNGKFNNTANNSVQTETVNEKTLTAGLRLYFNPFFFQGSYSWVSIKDTARGQTNLDISANSSGFGGVLGVTLPLVSIIHIELLAEVNNVTFAPGPGGFSSKAQYLRYGGMIGLSFAIPSSTTSADDRTN